MCGIAGRIGRRLPDDRIEACLALMGRRGPDHREAYRHDRGDGSHVALLHSRLSIIDLDPRSNQPFRRGSKVLATNGELYNFVELRREMESTGRSFSTPSDTEVLLAVLDADGPAGLDRCEGMWALALYDEADGSLLLSRDRFGEKPLYLLVDDDGLTFASEVKFLVALRGERLPIDADHLHRYLVNGYKALYKVESTFFEGLREMPAGTWAFGGPGGIERRERYWNPRYAPVEEMTYEQAVERARGALLRAVEIRLRADVPIAFCMSGGIDSNSLIGIARNVFDHEVHGFTIVNTDARYEEQAMVDAAVAEFGIRHTAIPVCTVDFLPRLRTLVRQHDAPVYTITYYAHWLLMEAIAAAGYRISVSGTGADELFTGYYDHHLFYLSAIHEQPQLHAASLAAWEAHVRPVVRNPFLSDPGRLVANPAFRDHIYLNADEFASYLHQPWSEAFAEEAYCEGPLRNRMANEIFHESVPVILHEDDLNAMYFSIENRSPFLDRELFEACASIPTRHLIREAAAKAVLRDAMRGLVPDAILDNRRKVGFNAPIFDFLDVSAPEVRASLLDASPIFDHVRHDRIEALIGRPDLPNSESKFLFYFLNAKIFLEEFGS